MGRQEHTYCAEVRGVHVGCRLELMMRRFLQSQCRGKIGDDDGFWKSRVQSQYLELKSKSVAVTEDSHYYAILKSERTSNFPYSRKSLAEIVHRHR